MYAHFYIDIISDMYLFHNNYIDKQNERVVTRRRVKTSITEIYYIYINKLYIYI